MDVRRLKKLPEIPLSYDLIVLDKGFSFYLNNIEIWFRLPSWYEYQKFITEIELLRPLFLSVDFSEEQIKKIAAEIEQALDIRYFDEIIKTLCLFYKPFSIASFTRSSLGSILSSGSRAFYSFRRFLSLQDKQTVFDLWILAILANQDIKKKVMAILVAQLQNAPIKEIWTTGANLDGLKKLSQMEKFRKAFLG